MPLALIQPDADPARVEAVREAMGWWGMLTIAGLVLLVTVAVLLIIARRLRNPGRRARRRGPQIKDAWAEAGRRAQPLPPDGADDSGPGGDRGE